MATITYTDGKYVTQGVDKTELKFQFGFFTWDATQKYWWTTDPEDAQVFVSIMDSTAWGVMQGQLEQRKWQVATSHAVDSKAKLPCPKGQAYLGYQKAGILFMKHSPATLLADEQGLGKTIQVAGAINCLLEAEPNKTLSILIVCRKALRLNWQEELAKWLIRPQTCNIVKPSIGITNDPIQIIPYDSVINYDNIIKLVTWDVFVVDEVHRLKNPRSQRTMTVFGSDRYGITPMLAKHKYYLTGTPMRNGRPMELWPILSDLDPTNWHDRINFGIRYCAGKQKKRGGKWDFTGSSNLDELQQKLRGTIMVRRLKENVLPWLPKKRRKVIELPADGCESAIKEELDAWRKQEVKLEKMKKAVDDASLTADSNPASYKASIAKLKRGVMASFGEMAKMRLKTALAKLPMVMTHIEATLDEVDKLVVFCHHISIADAIHKEFKDKFGAVVYTGKQSEVEQQAAKNRFQTDPDCHLFVGNSAAYEGITLTASSYEIFVELDWVPGNLSQAEDRCHRIGQLNSLMVEHLVLEGSLDATMVKKIIRKQEINERTMDDPDAPKTKDTAAARKVYNTASKPRGTHTTTPAPKTPGNPPHAEEKSAPAVAETLENLDMSHPL